MVTLLHLENFLFKQLTLYYGKFSKIYLIYLILKSP